MKTLVRTRLGRTFLIAFVLLSLPIIAAGWLGIRSAIQALRKETHILLRVASDGAEAQVREFLESLRRTTEARGADEEIRSALMLRAHSAGDLSGLLKRLRLRVPEAREIICINTSGKVVATSSPEMIGKDESSSIEFQRGQQSYSPGDIVSDAGVLRWRMSSPVKDPDTGRLLGVVVVGFNPDALNALTAGKRALAEGAGSQSFRMGETGETYLVNKDGFLLTESRFAPNS